MSRVSNLLPNRPKNYQRGSYIRCLASYHLCHLPGILGAMPPKPTPQLNKDVSSDNDSQDPTDLTALLHRHAHRLEQAMQADRDQTDQNLQRVLQDNHRLFQQSTNNMSEALTVARAISQSLPQRPAGALPAGQPRTSSQQPPPPSGLSRTTTSDPSRLPVRLCPARCPRPLTGFVVVRVPPLCGHPFGCL